MNHLAVAHTFHRINACILRCLIIAVVPVRYLGVAGNRVSKVYRVCTCNCRQLVCVGMIRRICGRVRQLERSPYYFVLAPSKLETLVSIVPFTH